MESLEELIRRYGLGEETEYVIIPFRGRDGRDKRWFLLKRPYIRIMYPDEHYADLPLPLVVEATVRYPELSLRESVPLVHPQEEVIVQPVASGRHDGDLSFDI